MEHEESYTLMMAALDGELDDNGRRQLNQHLSACGNCALEWQSLTAVDQLFRSTPALQPAAGFTQRTLARLPSRSLRPWLLSVIYIVLLLSGLLPLVAIGVAIWLLGPALNEPVLLQGLGQGAAELWQVGGALVGAFGQIASHLGLLIGQQPALMGTLLMMIGVIVLWNGVYQQIVGPLRPAEAWTTQ